jgi:hypothetical protein
MRRVHAVFITQSQIIAYERMIAFSGILKDLEATFRDIF